MYLWIERFFEVQLKGYQRVILGGLCLSILIVLIPPLYGEGFETINNLLREDYLAAIGTSVFIKDFDQTWTAIFLLLGLVFNNANRTSPAEAHLESDLRPHHQLKPLTCNSGKSSMAKHHQNRCGFFAE